LIRKIRTKKAARRKSQSAELCGAQNKKRKTKILKAILSNSGRRPIKRKLFGSSKRKLGVVCAKQTEKACCGKERAAVSLPFKKKSYEKKKSSSFRGRARTPEGECENQAEPTWAAGSINTQKKDIQSRGREISSKHPAGRKKGRVV